MAGSVTSPSSSAGPHSRVHLERDLEVLERDVRDLAALALTAITRAGAALVAGDSAARHEVVQGDVEADLLYQQIERHAFAVVAQHGPVASDLRRVIALLNTSLHLERIGDAAVNIATIGELTQDLPGDPEVLTILEAMVGQVAALLETAMGAFAGRDAEQARSLVALDDRLDALDRELFEKSLALDGSPGQRQWAFRMHELSRQLERAGDHAVDIGEQVYFFVTGEFSEFEDSAGPI
jgi:phosphate transport system protein